MTILLFCNFYLSGSSDFNNNENTNLMKKIFIVIACCVTLSTHAQFEVLLKKAKDKVAEKVEKKETTKVSNEVVNNTSGTSNNNANTAYNTKSNIQANTALQTKDAATNPNTNLKGKIIFGTAPFTTPGSSNVSSFKSNQFIYGQDRKSVV